MFKFPNDGNKESRYARIRRLKRWLRPLPRRATIHRYPILKWFAETARKRSFLWSFRKSEVIPAIYSGCILSLLPLYGFQVLLAFGAALIFRANLMVVVALQFISNPLTVPFLYLASYKTGDFILTAFGFDFQQEIVPKFAEVAAAEADEPIPEPGSRSRVGYWIFATMIGGFILGLGLAIVLSITYQFIARKTHFFKTQASADDDSTKTQQSEADSDR